jgi:glucokinase
MLIDSRDPDRSTPGYPALLADIGGTHARFAIQSDPGAAPRHVQTLRCADHRTLADAARAYLDTLHGTRPASAALAIANPVTGDEVRMTNHHWSFSILALRRELGLGRAVVMNDFTALALALPVIPPEHLQPVGGGERQPRAPMVVLGPGTGLGVSGLVPDGHGGYIALSGEGGHVTLAAGNEREAAVLARIAQRFGHASAERALSGPGLQNLYQALSELDGAAAEALSPAEISERGLSGVDARCEEAIELFCSLLGALAGNFALTLGAFGGVFIGGGIVPRWGERLARSGFRERFEAKGRFRDYLAAIPTYVICAPVSPSLQGAALALVLDETEPCLSSVSPRDHDRNTMSCAA